MTATSAKFQTSTRTRILYSLANRSDLTAAGAQAMRFYATGTLQVERVRNGAEAWEPALHFQKGADSFIAED